MGPKGWCCSFSVGGWAGHSVYMAIYEGTPGQNPWGHAPPSQRPHLGPLLCSLHSIRLMSACLLGANPNARSASRVPSKGARCRNAGDWGLPSPVPDSLCRQAATWVNRDPATHSGGRKGRALRAPGNIRRHSMPKPLGPRSPHQHPHFGLPLFTTHSHRHTFVGLLEANPNLGWPPRGPSQGALGHNAENWGPPSPSARLTLSSGRHLSPSGPHGSFRMGDSAETSEPPASFEGTPC